MKSGVIFITYHCQKKCHYCWQRQGNKVGEYLPTPFIDSTKWIEAINRIGFSILDISGGEPFLQPGLVDIIEGSNCKFGLTSNLGLPVDDFIQRIMPYKVVSLTASYHPSEPGDERAFFDKVLSLRCNGFNVTVNFVGHPDQLHLLESAAKKAERAGAGFHVDPFVPFSGTFEYTEEQKKMLNGYVGDDRKHYINKAVGGIKQCSGGREHLHIQPNGDAFRCHKDYVLRLPKIGNIFSQEFKGNDKDTPCGVWFDCLGCDKDKVSIHD